MLHELLLALRGYTGGLFVERDLKVKVVSVPFLHPGEESLMNRICEYGSYYKQFQTFIEEHRSIGGVTASTHAGLYKNALCYCLQEILEEYEQAIVELEREALLNSDLSLTYIQNYLQQYMLLFPSISNLLIDIQKRKARGCQLLDIVYKSTTTGIPLVKVAMNRLLFGLHKVMYKQLSSWLLHGILLDSYGEFFVHKVRKVQDVKDPGNQDEELGILGITGEQLKEIQLGQQDRSMPKDDIEQFSLNPEMLPSYFSARLLHKILFIGESVDMFENNDKLVADKSILRHKVKEFSKELYKLSERPAFSVMEFECSVDMIRECVAERLWAYVVKDSNLMDILRRIKDIYLLGRGDVISFLISAADIHLSCSPTAMTTHDVNRVFQQVLRTLNVSDELATQFKLSVEIPQKNASSKQNGWQLLSLEYRPTWPLHVFFTPVTQERYNTIFRFLLAVKQVHAALHNAWKHQMTNWLNQSPEELATLDQLRSHMLFLVDNLQYYLQVDVIESQFSQLLEKIDSTRDFEVIRTTHEAFLMSLLSQCFLLNKPVNHCLMCILECCHSFCATLETLTEAMTPDQWNHARNLQAMFQKQTLLLFKILSSSRTHQGNPYLVQLLLRIDYNKYFSSAGQQFG